MLIIPINLFVLMRYGLTRFAANLVEKIIPGIYFAVAGSDRVYLTFDDGPHPETTPRILDLLDRHQVKATFFCTGMNAGKYPLIYESILAAGHKTGNHSWSHPNGWTTPADKYVADVNRASAIIRSGLFRPPYGRITPFQYHTLKEDYRIIMWTRQFADYRKVLNPDKVNTSGIRAGEILVLHDSVSTAANTIPLLKKLLAGSGEYGVIQL